MTIARSCRLYVLIPAPPPDIKPGDGQACGNKAYQEGEYATRPTEDEAGMDIEVHITKLVAGQAVFIPVEPKIFAGLLVVIKAGPFIIFVEGLGIAIHAFTFSGGHADIIGFFIGGLLLHVREYMIIHCCMWCGSAV
jgi:hypothetical protein